MDVCLEVLPFYWLPTFALEKKLNSKVLLGYLFCYGEGNI